MKQEIDAVRDNHILFGVPSREHYDRKIPQAEFDLRFRLVREETEETKMALLKKDLVKIADGIADTMVVTAGSGVQLGIQPGVDDMVLAASELLEDARKVFEMGLRVKDPRDIAGGMCMLEIVCRGVAALLNLPYWEVFQIVHANNMAKVGPDGKPIFDAGGKFLKPEGHPKADGLIRQHLEARGLIKPQEDDNGGNDI